jgi:hypothetical protein
MSRVLSAISAASRSIFGHLGELSPYGPQHPGLRRSPRKYLHRKLKCGALVGYHEPFVQPTLRSGKRYRQIEQLQEDRMNKELADLSRGDREQKAAANRAREEAAAAARAQKKADRQALMEKMRTGGK